MSDFVLNFTRAEITQWDYCRRRRLMPQKKKERHSSSRRWGSGIALKKRGMSWKKEEEGHNAENSANRLCLQPCWENSWGLYSGEHLRIWKFIRNLYHTAKDSCMLYPEVGWDQQAHLFLFKLQVKLAFWQQARRLWRKSPLHSRWFHWKFLCFPPLCLLLQLPAAVSACLSDLSLPKRTQFTSQSRTPEHPPPNAPLNLSRMVIHKCSLCRSLEFLQGRGSKLMSFCSFFSGCLEINTVNAAISGSVKLPWWEMGDCFPRELQLFSLFSPVEIYNYLGAKLSRTSDQTWPSILLLANLSVTWTYSESRYQLLLQTSTTGSRHLWGQLRATLQGKQKRQLISWRTGMLQQECLHSVADDPVPVPVAVSLEAADHCQSRRITVF